jgi:hypothetical protein
MDEYRDGRLAKTDDPVERRRTLVLSGTCSCILYLEYHVMILGGSSDENKVKLTKRQMENLHYMVYYRLLDLRGRLLM